MVVKFVDLYVEIIGHIGWMGNVVYYTAVNGVTVDGAMIFNGHNLIPCVLWSFYQVVVQAMSTVVRKPTRVSGFRLRWLISGNARPLPRPLCI